MSGSEQVGWQGLPFHAVPQPFPFIKRGEPCSKGKFDDFMIHGHNLHLLNSVDAPW
jgi:hypothetical protein